MKKKIFITGATGFIGSHLCEMGAKKGYQVVGFDRYNSNNDLGWLKKSKYINNKRRQLYLLKYQKMKFFYFVK